MFTGTYTALVTPFRDGKVDEEAFGRLIQTQIKGGVDGIVPVGTTGESPTLDYQEHLQVIKLAIQFAAKKVKVLAGTGANSTQEAIYLTEEAERLGANGSLQVAPYYNKPTQEGLFQHFSAIARKTKLPIILYSVPSRCGVEIAVDTVVRLQKACKNIVGIKEAGGNVDRVSQLRQAVESKFIILSGDDALTVPFISVGARGVVSVASNVAPKQVSQMVRLAMEGKSAMAQKAHEKLYPLFKDLFIESNPIPAKAALSMMGLMESGCRLPLTEMGEKNRAALRQTLVNCGLLRA